MENQLKLSEEIDETKVEDEESEPMPDESVDQVAEHPLQDLAVVNARPNKPRGENGCWYQFRYGNCTKPNCPLEHDKDAMMKFQDQKLRDLSDREECRVRVSSYCKVTEVYSREGPCRCP
jgi:hypothetical protein